MPHSYTGYAGGSTNAYTTQFALHKQLDRMVSRRSLFSHMMEGSSGRPKKVKMIEYGGQDVDVLNSNIVQSKPHLNNKDECRFTLIKDLYGEPTFNDEEPRSGGYLSFLHDGVYLNEFHSPEYDYLGEMDTHRLENSVPNLKAHYKEAIADYAAEWLDISGLEALLFGADRGNLLTSDGGRGMQLMNATAAGETLSCKNTYVAGHGWVAWNDTRATFEANIGTEIYDLIDDSDYGWSLNLHHAVTRTLASSKKFKKAELYGKQINGIVLTDPWIVARIQERTSGNDYYNMFKDAGKRGKDNPVINSSKAIVLDGWVYVSCEWLRAYRAYGNDGVKPTYGAGITNDPRTWIDTYGDTYKKCAMIFLGARALLNASSEKVYTEKLSQQNAGRIYFTTRKPVHTGGGGIVAHMKQGMKRYEPEAKDGTTEYQNYSTAVIWTYDPGPGVSFAA